MTVGIIRTGNAASLGAAGTTKTLISPSSGLFMPSDAKALLSVKASISKASMTAAETIAARLDIESSDVRNMSPYEVLFAPVLSSLAASVTAMSSNEDYDINAPLQGGEALSLYGTCLVAQTIAPQAQAWVIVSNNMQDLVHPLTRSMKPQVHSKLGTFTNSGVTADTDVAGTKYSFSGGRRITDLIGFFAPLAVNTADYMIGEIKFTSSEFVDSIPQSLPLEPLVHGSGLSSLTYLSKGVARQKVDIPVKPGQVNIQDYMNFGGVVTATGNFIDGVMYV